MLNIKHIASCASTNTELAAMHDAPHGTVVWTGKQTAGRGQRGNSWESEPGKNLTFSLLLRPASIRASRQFELSMLVSLGIVEALGECGVEACIKWPNDIYAGGDRKICGILIENTISGSGIERSVAGIGLNVNQEVFRSDAPNPVSIKNITGTECALEPLLESVCCKITGELAAYESAPDAEALGRRYFGHLWRGDGKTYPFRDILSGEIFRASIAGVGSDGVLSLLPEGSRDAGALRKYLFKEVEFLLK